MALDSVVLKLALIVATMLATATLVVVGPRPMADALRNARWRIGAIALPAATLVGVLTLRWGTRDLFYDLTWRVFGMNITPVLFDLDALLFPDHPVILLQSYRSDALTTVLSFVYIYGYAFLLVFPIVAYFALDEERLEHLSTLLLSFTVNYAIGLAFYVLFISYGPRNLDPAFQDLLYSAHPESGWLTHTVNQPTNVFPSLHTSMAMTVFFLAWRTREEYPTWVPIAGVLAISVTLSTMYLGIHWFTDAVAGTLLALVSVYVGANYTVEELLGRASGIVVAAAGRPWAFATAKLGRSRTDEDCGESPRGE